MGDRGNVWVVDEDGKGVCLYGHYSGDDMPMLVQAALKRGMDRWDDAAYLTRIIFCEILPADDLKGTSHFGISAHLCDCSDHYVVVVDCRSKKVGFMSEEVVDENVAKGGVGEWTFEEYVKLPKGKIVKEYR